jgi:hypothetical protein
MKSKLCWRRLSGSTKTRINRLIARGWTPASAWSPYGQRRHHQEEIESAPVTSQDLALVEGERP